LGKQEPHSQASTATATNNNNNNNNNNNSYNMGATCSLPSDADQTIDLEKVDSKQLVCLMHHLNHDATPRNALLKDSCEVSSAGPLPLLVNEEAKNEAAATQEEAEEGDGLYAVAKFDKTISVYTGVVVVEFRDNKGSQVKASFLAKKVGFSLGVSQSPFCGRSAHGPRVVVKSVDKGGHAAKLGITRGLEVRMIDGVEVTGVHQAEKTLACALKQLPESC